MRREYPLYHNDAACVRPGRRRAYSTAKEKPGRFRCKRCGAVSKKKSDICEPKKIRKSKKKAKKQ